MEQRTYKIGEAASLLNLKTYVLRFWETEFSQIAPLRTEKGQRLYTEKDITTLKRIRFLLHDRGLTIEGAKRILQEELLRGHDFVDSSLLYLDDDDERYEEELSSDQLFSLDDVQETSMDLQSTDAEASFQIVPSHRENSISFNEPLFQSSEEVLASSVTSLQQVATPTQTVEPDMSEQYLRQYILHELEDIAKILRSRINLGDPFQ